jgi:hypothetical protein
MVASRLGKGGRSSRGRVLRAKIPNGSERPSPLILRARLLSVSSFPPHRSNALRNTPQHQDLTVRRLVSQEV